jgi:peptide chain release factor 1
VFNQLDEVEKKYEQYLLQLENPSVVQDNKKYTELMRTLAELREVVETYRAYKKAKADHQANLNLLSESDEELRDLAKEEIKSLEALILDLESKLKVLLLPKDPNDEKNIIIEIRAGAGGDEASLFAQELYEAYLHYAHRNHWRVELISCSDGNVGGYKEVIAKISGDKVYSKLKFESGVHRVQRVPKTETQGRVHTSTVTVAIVPEQKPSEVKINLNEVRVDVTRSQGSGGQSVNTTDSAVRVTHLPTGIIVFCQQGKSQHSNKEMAFQILYSKLVQLEEEKRQKEASDMRLAQIGTGDRSERIRTYNFPQSRVTDHRIGFTSHALSDLMAGHLEIVIDPLIAHYQAQALQKHDFSSAQLFPHSSS